MHSNTDDDIEVFREFSMIRKSRFLLSPLYYFALFGAIGLTVVGCWLVETNGGGGWRLLSLIGWAFVPTWFAVFIARFKHSSHDGETPSKVVNV